MDLINIFQSKYNRNNWINTLNELTKNKNILTIFSEQVKINITNEK